MRKLSEKEECKMKGFRSDFYIDNGCPAEVRKIQSDYGLPEEEAFYLWANFSFYYDGKANLQNFDKALDRLTDTFIQNLSGEPLSLENSPAYGLRIWGVPSENELAMSWFLEEEKDLAMTFRGADDQNGNILWVRAVYDAAREKVRKQIADVISFRKFVKELRYKDIGFLLYMFRLGDIALKTVIEDGTVKDFEIMFTNVDWDYRGEPTVDEEYADYDGFCAEEKARSRKRKDVFVMESSLPSAMVDAMFKTARDGVRDGRLTYDYLAALLYKRDILFDVPCQELSFPDEDWKLISDKVIYGLRFLWSSQSLANITEGFQIINRMQGITEEQKSALKRTLADRVCFESEDNEDERLAGALGIFETGLFVPDPEEKYSIVENVLDSEDISEAVDDYLRRFSDEELESNIQVCMDAVLEEMTEMSDAELKVCLCRCCMRSLAEAIVRQMEERFGIQLDYESVDYVFSEQRLHVWFESGLYDDKMILAVDDEKMMGLMKRLENIFNVTYMVHDADALYDAEYCALAQGLYRWENSSDKMIRYFV